MTGNRVQGLAFQFVGGNPALDFTNTVSWGRDGLAEERLDSYSRLLQWARGAKLPMDAHALARRAAADPRGAARALTAARAARAELHDLFLARAAGLALPKAHLDGFNRRLTASLARLDLRQENDDLMWRLKDSHWLESPVHWVMWEAAKLLASNEPIGRCANPDCGWVYLDRSRRGNRRWCDMAACGARHKARQYYRRQRLRSRSHAKRKPLSRRQTS